MLVVSDLEGETCDGVRTHAMLCTHFSCVEVFLPSPNSLLVNLKESKEVCDTIPALTLCVNIQFVIVLVRTCS